jgi:hypothetical protein
MTDLDRIKEVLDAMKATGFTGDVSIRVRVQEGGVRRIRFVDEKELDVVQIVTLTN